jgi:predicted DNA binding CopG/RHH family protein
MKNQLNDFIPLDDEEQTLSESFEAGEWQTVSLTAEEKQSYVSAAQRTLKTLEKRQISIKLNPADISVVKAKAQETGIPYQNIIGALIHNYAIGKIKLEI